MLSFSSRLYVLAALFSLSKPVGGEDLIPLNDVMGFNPMGNPLVGVPTQDMATSLFGKTVSVSGHDGGRLVIGAPTHGFATPTADDSRLNQDGGAVFLYEFDDFAMSWELLWFLPGLKGEALGSAVSISSDGSRVAVRRRRGGTLDFAEVYEIQTNKEIRLGAPIGCIGGGSGLSLAPSGERLAVSCESYDSERGRVEIFDFDGSSWVPSGVFQGDNPGDLFGWSTSFSANGERIAISAPSYTFDSKRTRCGMVQVHELNKDKSWSQVGGNLIGYDKFEGFGMSLDLSGDGRTVAIGSPGNSANGMARAGAVKAFFDFRGVWLQTGSDITGTNAGDEFGEAVSVSGNGGRLAATSPNHGSLSGHVRLFDLHNGEWVQHGDDISGLEGGTRLGYGRFGVSLDGNGRRLAYGSPFCGLTGCVHVVEYAKIPEQPAQESEQPIISREESDAESAVDKLDWDIVFVDAFVRFQEDSPASIEVNYEIHARSSAVTLFEADCREPLAGSLITVKSTSQAVSPKKESLSVEMDIHLDQLSGSPIYTEPDAGAGLLSICIRVDLLDGDMTSVVFDQRRLSVLLDTFTHFEVVDVQLDETEEHTDVKASVEYAVTACQCDESLTCVDMPVDPDADTLICLGTDMDEVRVASIEKLEFFKGSLSQTAVRNGREDALTIIKQQDEQVVIRTRLVSAFFEGSDSSGIHARGICTLSFVHNGPSRALRRGTAREMSINMTHSDFSVELLVENYESSASKRFCWGIAIIIGLALLMFSA